MTHGSVRVGRVRSGRKLAVHLAIHGATCSSRREINVEVNERAATARLCRKCFTPARIARAQQANNYGKAFNMTAAKFLAAVTESQRTPEERAASAAKFAQTAFARDIAAANVPAPRRPVRTFAEIYADFHPQTIEPVHPDQLALLPAAA